MMTRLDKLWTWLLIGGVVLIAAFVFAAASARAQSTILTCTVNGPGPACSAIANAGVGTTGAVVATLPARTNYITYICGFDVSALGGTATVGPIVVAGLVGATTFTYQFSSTAAGATLNRAYTPCIPANAQNTTITVTTTADGSASAVDVNAWGFQQGGP